MKKLLLSFLLIAALVAAQTSPARACGPSFVEPVFAFDSRAENFGAFARGEIGVVTPRFNRTFLTVAYRYFNNRPFTAREQQDLVDVWRAQYESKDANERDTNQAVANWIAARKKVLPNEPEPKIYTDRNYDGGYNFFPNCTRSAFETATATLENRAAQHGAGDKNVQEWLRGQDKVFNNCAADKNAVSEVGANAPEWLKNDRDYQIAAAQFYATDYDNAIRNFSDIANNQNSIWRNTANYLVARTLIRQASFAKQNYYEADDAKRKEIDGQVNELYRRAETQLDKITADASQKDFHEPARKLLNLIYFRTRPDERQHELAAILTNPNENPNLRLDLIDYGWLLDKNVADDYERAEKAAQEAAQKAGKESIGEFRLRASDVAPETRRDDLTDWILTVQTIGDRETAQYAAKKWRETNQPQWFVAAIMQADKNSTQLVQLLTEAERVENTSPQFATVAFNQVRLLVETGKTGEARQKLDRILADKTAKMPLSARNRFQAERAQVAASFDEFLQFAARPAVAFATDGSPYLVEDLNPKAPEGESYLGDARKWQSRVMFDYDTAEIFNEQVPLAVLKQAVTNARLPDYLQRTALIAAWTRAVLLNDDRTAQELAPQFAKLAPEFQPVFAQYTNAAIAAERDQAATYILLKFPALRPNIDSGYGRTAPISEIDSYRDNWWCAPKDNFTISSGETVKFDSAPAPAFLSAEQFAAARRERRQIAALGDSATYLAKRAVEFANAAPTDARVPESLHLAVRASRYGCTDCETGKYSKAAHDLLKKNYPRSEYVKKTPYWFKDESCDVQK